MNETPGTSQATTRGVRVVVSSRLDPTRSHPARGQWFFLYHIVICNDGEETVQLLNRHWVITDGLGRVEEVRGEGVVGQQPVIAPGERFEYSSGCPLTTEFGSMEGSYEMLLPSGDTFWAEVASFTLSTPFAVN